MKFFKLKLPFTLRKKSTFQKALRILQLWKHGFGHFEWRIFTWNIIFIRYIVCFLSLVELFLSFLLELFSIKLFTINIDFILLRCKKCLFLFSHEKRVKVIKFQRFFVRYFKFKVEVQNFVFTTVILTIFLLKWLQDYVSHACFRCKLQNLFEA